MTLAFQGFNSIALNKTRDAKHKSDEVEITRNRAAIKEALASATGRESETINRLITEHGDERNFLLPILESQFVSREALDRLARSDDSTRLPAN